MLIIEIAVVHISATLGLISEANQIKFSCVLKAQTEALTVSDSSPSCISDVFPDTCGGEKSQCQHLHPYSLYNNSAWFLIHEV